MKSQSHSFEGRVQAPREERQIFDQFCDDHEMLERLRVTPQELGALKKCVLLGTLTCKEDLLFILREIRIATEDASEETTIASAPTPCRDDKTDDPPKELGAKANRRRVAPVRNLAEPGSLEAVARSRPIEQFGVLCWTVILLGFLTWNVVAGMSSWRQHLLARIGVQAHHPVARDR
jgi:hypothetical protein